MKLYTRYSKREPIARNFTLIKDKEGNITNPECQSQTKQSERDACNINTIVAKSRTTGMLGTGKATERAAQYGDFTGGGDYLESQNKVLQFNNMFNDLSSAVRAKFRNQPALLLEYINKPENKKEAQELGLLPKPVIKRALSADGKELIHTKDGEEIGRTPAPKPKPDAPEKAPPPPAEA